MTVPTSSGIVQWQSQDQVFLNFRGEDLRLNFISHLVKALKRENINVFIDAQEEAGQDLTYLFQRIAESRIVIAVISINYTQSKWCLDELVKIKEGVKGKTLKVFPVFYKVDTKTVKEQRGAFGDNFRDLKKHNPEKSEAWKEALQFVTEKVGQKVDEKSDEGLMVDIIVDEVKKMLANISRVRLERKNAESTIGKGKGIESSASDTSPFFGIKTRREQLEDKLAFDSDTVTRVIGVVGMPGIGKTTLAKELFEKWRNKFVHTKFVDDIRGKSTFPLIQRLHVDLLMELQKKQNKETEQNTTEVSIESLKAQIKKNKVFIVLDDVSDKKQIEAILRSRDWIKEGSKVVITTSSLSAIKDDMVDDTYLVPELSDNDALNHFNNHAFSSDEESKEGNFMKLARQFVDYSRGHPLTLKVLGGELRNKNEAHWKSKLEELAKSPSKTIQDVLRITYNELSENHKNVFLDVACFFRFDDEYHARSLLDSLADNVSEIRDLADKFFINICGGRVEMNDLLYTFAMVIELQSSSKNTQSARRLLDHHKIIAVLKTKATNVRGIFLDMSEVTKTMSLLGDTFSKMRDLRYLKFFNSRCHKECEKDDCKLYFPDGLEFPLQEIRYLHWLKFPLKKLPHDFSPKNLVDLKLPYSQIEQVWEEEKDASKLKWLDLNHSRNLLSLSGLSRARKLQNMNLEGCTSLKTVIQLRNMESLAFLNLRGCTSLESLPEMNLVCLNTLILSGCSNLEEFRLISINLEELYLDGTAITGLPSTIGNLQRLTLLKLKNCKSLRSLPDSIEDLKAIQEIILSGCKKLKSFPKIKQNLKHLKTLLLDGTAITEMPDFLHILDQGQTSSGAYCELCEWPRGTYGLSSVRRLSLSRNEFTILPTNIIYLYHLKWLDLKYCKKLISIPRLPPNLQWLDAHGCVSLEKIANPLALMLAETEHLHSTFIFSNCTKLDHVAENNIVSYARKKMQLMSNSLAHYDEGFVLDILIGVCFPGWQVPAWFNHRFVGSSLKLELPRHWSEGGLTGIALCAVVSFTGNNAQTSRFSVRSSCEFKEKDKPLIEFSCILGGWTENVSEEPRKIESGHVFIGYTSWLHNKKCGEGETEYTKRCAATEASLTFDVTDGTRKVTNCEIVKCGFSLIYAPTEPVHSLCINAIEPINGDIRNQSTNTRRNIQGGERYSRTRTSLSSDLLVAPTMLSSRVVDVTRSESQSNMASTSGSNFEAMHRGQTSSSLMVNSNLSGGSNQTIVDANVNGSTSEESTRRDIEGTTCLSFLQAFIQCLPR